MEHINIIEIAQGAVNERINYELLRVIDNINDVNTKAEATRKITVTLELKPDGNRENISLTTTVKSSIQPTNSIKTALYMANDGESQCLVEMTPNIPGQMGIDGTEQKQPKVIPLRKTI